MKYLFLAILLLPTAAGAQRFQLGHPQMTVDSVFFRKSAKAVFAFDLDGAQIRYTINSGVPNDSAPVYKTPLKITETGALRARAYHPDFLPGALTEQQFVKVLNVPDSTALQTAPDDEYAGRKGLSLFDFRKGSRELKDGQWLGFRKDSVVIVDAWFKKPVTCKTVLLSAVFDPSSWIFQPRRIEVYGANGDKAPQYMGVWNSREDARWQGVPAKYSYFLKVLLRPAAMTHLQLRIYPYGPMPKEHAAYGQKAWLFIDEIVFD